MAQQQMSLRSRAFTANAKAPRLSSRAVAVRAGPSGREQQQAPLMNRLAPSMLAALVTLSSGLPMVDVVYNTPVARADVEEGMTPYQKRQAEMEKRRELLREAREKAAARAAGTAVVEAPPPAAAAPAAPSAPSLSSNSLQTYKAATQNRPSIPTPAPEPAESSAPKWGGFSFSKPAEEPEKPAATTEKAAPAAKKDAGSSSSNNDTTGNMFTSDMWNAPIKPKASAPAVTPAPVAPVTPLPAPSLFNKAPEPAVKPPKAPEPVQQKKAAPEAAKPAAADSKKRRGPLPLWFAEVLVLGAYAGMFLAVTKYSKQSGEVLAGLWAKVVEAYNALDKMIGSKKQAV